MDDVTAPPNSLYERDFHEWALEQARLLRERRWDELDLDNLVDEVESVGRSQKHQIYNRLKVLIAHLLKWKFQPGARSAGWRGTIRTQRDRLHLVLDDSPSLRAHPDAILDKTYLAARLLAAKETGIDFTLFPETCPFTIEQVLDEEFWPKEPDLYDQS
ncbi:MAG TPA: DUF29 domain-containing protein [Beijerinckiaceae bacterium]|jgi:hypothetical protein